MEAKKYGLRGMCTTPYTLDFVMREMEGSGIPVVGIVAFPSGFAPTKVKVFETQEMVGKDVDSIDCMINYVALRSGDVDYVKRELDEMVAAARKINPGIEIKFIIEATMLDKEMIITASKLVKESGADVVKTSTGWRGGCTLEHIRIMREAVGPDFGVKAAGGHIATTEKALAMLEAGANMIGENNCCQIMEGYDLLVEKRSTRG
jgi:deoxyribose-phosphate aldolase